MAEAARRGSRSPTRAALLSSAVLLGRPACALADGAAVARPAFEDGRPAAPPGPAQLPRLLDGYAARPPWAVAGVDYAVGRPRDATLKDPAAISDPGAVVDPARRTVFVNGDGVVLDGYDFGGADGWGVYVNPPATGTLVQNSSFRVGARNLVPIHAARGTGDLTVRRCTFDGGGGADAVAWALVAYSGSGVLIAEYNVFADAPADAIDMDSGTMTAVVRFNLFENLGTAPGSHPDSVQFTGVQASDSVIDFNTVYQPHPSGMQGIQVSAQLASKISRTQVMNNTIVAKGPGIDMSYLVAIGQTADSEIDGAVVADNYLDVRGAYGSFYPPTGRHLSFLANTDAATGRPIDAPAGAAANDVVAAAVSPASESSGAALALTLDRAAVVTGRPAIRLADGSRAVYAEGSGTKTLVFTVAPAARERAARTSAALSPEFPEGARIVDANGNRIVLQGALAGLSLPARPSDPHPPLPRTPDRHRDRASQAGQARPDEP